jgi:hypothetical protein
MPRARSSYTSDWQTAASTQGSGCLSGFLIPPLAVLIVGLLLAFFVKGLNIPVQAKSLPPAVTIANGTSVRHPLLHRRGIRLLRLRLWTNLPPVPSTSLSPIFTPEIHYWADSIIRWAAASNLDPNLAAVVMQIESCGDPRATSRAGAMGLFQVMPYHFARARIPIPRIPTPCADSAISSALWIQPVATPAWRWPVTTAASASSAAANGPGLQRRQALCQIWVSDL